ncbi:MAG: AAA family ATPase [Piscirickettsiaceae bacterium]|nr:AAA family ATPase [Piscirickettsiaceae bacterium]
MSKITCRLCGEEVHSIQLHLRDAHENASLEDYQESYPDAPVLSEKAKERLARNKTVETVEIEMATAAKVIDIKSIDGFSMKPLAETFGLGRAKAALSKKGESIPIRVFDIGRDSEMIPDNDNGYIFNIDLLKTTLMGLELNIPVYLWGHAGVGKSTVLEQIASHTKRPYIRVQHTANTEESHIVGQTLANESGTYFEPGPLALAMKHGWMYNADEYDFAHASILAVYQPVLEGKSLVIKEAPPEWRIVQPHADFRFVATGNTNGSGDETGLYIGTNMGNAANYSRFGIIQNVEYMPAKQEAQVIVSQAGIVSEDAQKLIQFATDIRKAYDAGTMSATIGPRELIYAAKIGFMKGSWTAGLQLSFVNRLGSVDRETAAGVAQRIFG